MRGPGVWYVLQSVEIKSGHRMAGIGITGSTPEDAVEEYWRAVTDDLTDNQCIVARAGRPTRMAVRWNGFLWSPVDEVTRSLA